MAAKPKRGRPQGSPKLTPAIQAKVCESLRLGNTRENAARSARIGRTTLFRWMQQGKSAKAGQYRDFWNAIQDAESECENRYAALIQRAALEREEKTVKVTTVHDKDGRPLLDKNGKPVVRIETTSRTVIDWGAAAWWLERRRKEWAGNSREHKELQKQLNAILKAIERGHITGTHSPSESRSRAGGDVSDSDSI